MNGDQVRRIRTFLRLGDPEAQQSDTLLRKAVWPNANSGFGKRHDFNLIRTVQDFRHAVPVCRYDDIQPHIERMLEGEQGVLVSEPVRRFFITSGSTAKPKYVPLTNSFIRDKWRTIQAFWALVQHDHPGIEAGTVITNFSDGSQQTRTPGGLLCGSESSFWNSWGKAPTRLGQSGLPQDVCRVPDAKARYYAIARVLIEQDISVLMALNPSTLLLLLETIEKQFSSLVRNIASGGISVAMELPPTLRREFVAAYPGNATRAQQLHNARTSAGNGHNLASIWPNLRVAISWRSPMVMPYLELLRQYLGSVPQRDYLLIASEGVVAIPYEDNVSGGVLATGTHFYEFIPEHLSDCADPPTLLAGQLERGARYVTVLTTSAGLYRYNLGDVVQVRDFLGRTPVIEFLHRTGHTCSLTGEKLTEDQVAQAIAQVAARFRVNLQGFTMSPVSKPFPHYRVVVEFGRGSEPSRPESFLGEIDRELSSRNVEYKSKRESRRLGVPELCVVAPGSYSALRQERSSARVSDAQVKLPCLTRDAQFGDQFEVLHSCFSAA